MIVYSAVTRELGKRHTTSGRESGALTQRAVGLASHESWRKVQTDCSSTINQTLTEINYKY